MLTKLYYPSRWLTLSHNNLLKAQEKYKAAAIRLNKTKNRPKQPVAHFMACKQKIQKLKICELGWGGVSSPSRREGAKHWGEKPVLCW